MPERIQMSRQHPWRADHPDAVIVDRSTRWGNPYAVARRGQHWVVLHPGGRTLVEERSRTKAFAASVVAFVGAVHGLDRDVALPFDEHDVAAQLAGRDLACWCPPGQPCHAEALLIIANKRSAR